MRQTCEEFLMSYRRTLEQVNMLDDQIVEAEMIHRHLSASYEVDPVRTSKDRREAESPELLDLKEEKEKLLADSRRRRDEISAFIANIGRNDRTVAPLVMQRYRKALQLYYCDLLSWGEIRQLMRPLHMRKGKVVVNTGRGRGISEGQMFHLRSEALAHAEIAYQKQI